MLKWTSVIYLLERTSLIHLLVLQRHGILNMLITLFNILPQSLLMIQCGLSSGLVLLLTDQF